MNFSELIIAPTRLADGKASVDPLRSVQFRTQWRPHAGGGYTQGAHLCLRTYASALVICWRE